MEDVMRVIGMMVLLVGSTAGCGSAETGSVKEGKACSVALDCADGLVCLAYGDAPGSCSLDCSASADVCGAEASCAGVGSVSVDVCQDDDKVVSDDNPAESEDDIPYIPCVDDAECQALGGGSRMVCGEWMGLRQCTLSCEAEPDCDVLPDIDLFTCIADEADSSRDICAPDMDCFTDPLSCIDIPDGF
jgi:hypothetical protein